MHHTASLKQDWSIGRTTQPAPASPPLTQKLPLLLLPPQMHDIEDEGELERRYTNLDLPDEQRILINDYIACVKTCDNRYSDISYMAGIKDAVRMFVYLGLLKDYNISEQGACADGQV